MWWSAMYRTYAIRSTLIHIQKSWCCETTCRSHLSHLPSLKQMPHVTVRHLCLWTLRPVPIVNGTGEPATFPSHFDETRRDALNHLCYILLMIVSIYFLLFRFLISCSCLMASTFVVNSSWYIRVHGLPSLVYLDLPVLCSVILLERLSVWPI